MNFLVTLIRFATILMIIFFVGFFGGREILLYAAASQVAADARLLTVTQRWQNQTAGCESNLIDGQTFDGFQLRFLSGQEYALEVHCLAKAPAQWQLKSLPFMVRKTTGSAGFFYNFVTQELTGELTLELWGQQKLVYAEEKRARQVWGRTGLRAAQPASVCAAHGLVCCDAVLETGDGEIQTAGVTDCPASCFPACLKRPLLLSFQTDPPGDYRERRLRIAERSALVLFNFVFDDREAPLEKVAIDFGDGTSQEIAGMRNGQFSKEYICPGATCSYVVRLRATDSRGIESPQRRDDTLTVELGVPPVQ